MAFFFNKEFLKTTRSPLQSTTKSLAVIGITLGTLTAGAFAQEQNTEQVAETVAENTQENQQTSSSEQSEQVSDDTDEAEDENSEQVAEDGSFIPSEEISEDLSVAFPVDI